MLEDGVYRAGGPALYFPRVKGCAFPMVGNLFGTLDRTRFLFRDTLEAVRAAAGGFPGITVVDNEVQRGKGYAVRQGMLRARGEIILFMDADLSTPLAEVRKFLGYFAAHPGVDVLIGNRRHPSSYIGQTQGIVRRNLSVVFNGLVRSRLGAGDWKDTQCGFKEFRRAAAAEIFSRQRLNGFSFDVEVLVLAAALGLRVVDLPV